MVDQDIRKLKTLQLMDLIRFHSHESEVLSPQTSRIGHSSNPSFPIIAVAIIGILATAFLLVGYYIFVIKCCLNWHRIDLLRRFSFSRSRRRVQDPLTVHSPVLENRGLDEAAIRSIPIFKFKKIGPNGNGDPLQSKSFECAVCLNEFQDDEKLRVIPNCAHVFHIDCIDIWLQNNSNCPMCRTSISATGPEIGFPMTHILDPSPSPQDPNPYNDNFTGRNEDYVVIEIGAEQDHSTNPSRFPESEFLSISPSPRKLESKISQKKRKTLKHVTSMGDEWIDNRKKDVQFAIQPIRRSFSMDSAADRQLYLAVQDIIAQQQSVVTSEVSSSEGCSRLKRSFFSFGHGRGSRSSAQPVALEPQQL